MFKYYFILNFVAIYENLKRDFIEFVIVVVKRLSSLELILFYPVVFFKTNY